MFLFLVLDEFEIQNRRQRKIKFLDQNGAVIAPDLLSSIIFQYKSCAYFSIRIVFTDENEAINVYVEVKYINLIVQSISIGSVFYYFLILHVLLI